MDSVILNNINRKANLAILIAAHSLCLAVGCVIANTIIDFSLTQAGDYLIIPGILCLNALILQLATLMIKERQESLSGCLALSRVIRAQKTTGLYAIGIITANTIILEATAQCLTLAPSPAMEAAMFIATGVPLLTLALTTLCTHLYNHHLHQGLPLSCP